MAKKKIQPEENKIATAEPTRDEVNGLEAMVNQKTRHGTVIAFSGNEYVRYEYRRVPAGFEVQAKAHPYLDVRACLSSAAAEADAAEQVIVGGAAPEEETKDETANPEGSDVTDETDTETTDNAGAETDEE